jgi:methionine-rich copper-binding protein CopC
MLMRRLDDKAMNRLLFIVLYCAMLLLSACQDTTQAPVPSNDTAVPTLVTQTPLPNAENVAADAEISVTFSEAISPDSVTDETVKIADASGTAVSKTTTLNDKTLTVKLTQLPNVPTRLTLELNGLSDQAGNKLAVTAWSWFVPASSYGNPEVLGDASAVTDARLEERPLQVATDDAGNVAVAWLNAGNLFVKSWNGTAWQQLGEEFDVSQSVYAPNIELFNGQPVVAFQEGKKLSETQNEPNGNILVYRWTGSAWEALGQVDVPERDAAAPSLAVANDGTLTIAYFEFDGVSSNVLVKRWAGSSWQPLGDVLDINPDRNAVFPSLVIDDSGNAVVAWYEDRAGDLSRNIYVKQWNGTAWEQLGTSLNINQKERADTFSLAVDANRQPVIAFSEFDNVGGSNNVYVRRWNGVDWQQVGMVVDNVAAQRAIYPSIAVDAANQISVAWYEALCQSVNPCNENDSVYLAHWDGAVWQQLGIQDTDAKREAYYPSLVSNGGAPVLAWIEGKTMQYQIVVKQYKAE